MTKTGRVGNIVLGVGDPSKFNLLGGSFGKAGDVLISGTGARARFVLGKEAAALRSGGARPYGSSEPRSPIGTIGKPWPVIEK